MQGLVKYEYIQTLVYSNRHYNQHPVPLHGPHSTTLHVLHPDLPPVLRLIETCGSIHQSPTVDEMKGDLWKSRKEKSCYRLIDLSYMWCLV